MNVKAMWLVIIGTFSLVMSVTSSAQSWTDSWLSSSTSTAPGSFNTQQRGYYTGGAFSMRWRQTEDHPITVTPPRLRFGCGGIDAFGGSLSYLDMDYLVQKVQHILQAAPTFAFQIALDEFCKQCTAAMMTAEQISDQINGIMVNDCQAAKSLVYAVKDYSSVAGSDEAESSSRWNLAAAYEKNYQQVKEKSDAHGGVPTRDTRDNTSECPNDFHDIFLGGSVVDNVTNMLGMNAYADTLRGYIGDAVVTYVEGSNAYTVEALEKCPGNDPNRPDDFITGSYDVRKITGQCVASGATGVSATIKANLLDLATSIKNGTALTPAQQALVNNSPVPVLLILKDAVASGTVAETVEAIADPLSLAYGYKILDDLYQAAHNVVLTAQRVSKDHNATGGSNKCDTQFVQGAIEWAQEKEPIVRDLRAQTSASLRQKLGEIQSSIMIARAYEDRAKKRQNEFGNKH